jgi:peptidoglycan-associated lipoprotein
MKLNVRIPALLVTMVVATGACGKKQPPPAPVPQQAPTNQAGPAPTNNPAGAMNNDGAAEAARNRATLAQRINFAYDEASLSDMAQSTLRSKVAILRADPSIRLRIEGHADERGSVEYNLALGMRRAQAAKEFLMGFGLDGSRFEIDSYGEDRPVDAGRSESAYSANRRDEFAIVAGSLGGR